MYMAIVDIVTTELGYCLCIGLVCVNTITISTQYILILLLLATMYHTVTFIDKQLSGYCNFVVTIIVIQRFSFF